MNNYARNEFSHAQQLAKRDQTDGKITMLVAIPLIVACICLVVHCIH